jgi:hypothetical protein
MINKNEKNLKRKLQVSFDDSDYEALAIAAHSANRSIAAQARHWIQEKLKQAGFEARKEKFQKEAERRELLLKQ